MKKKEGESLYFMDRIWVPLVGGVRTVIMDEAHKSKYSVHPEADKMYHDLRDMYWWPGMKRDIALFELWILVACFSIGENFRFINKDAFWILVAMSPPIRRKYRDSVAFATGRRKIKNCKRCNRKIRIPIGMWPCYETSEEEPVEQPRRHDLYGFVDHPQLQQGNPMNEFAPHRLPQLEGNMNGWLMEDEEELERNDVDSDLESTASSKPMWKKTTKDDPDRASRSASLL
ncbi:putative reverse transcriptase domain-containing protein [Tanacetum coccineum]